MKNIQKYTIIVAGGSGRRMGTEIPKQFLEVKGKPVLIHTLEKFYDYDPTMKLIIVLPKSQHEYWEELKAKHQCNIPHQVIKGGVERFFSVKNGLEHLPETGYIAVHDGVRPLVSHTTINNCFTKAIELGNAIPVVPATESIRKVKEGKSHSVLRQHYYMVQTPQVFKAQLLHKAYKQGLICKFTDDASVVEETGVEINLVEGNPENIKITRPMDIKIAESLI